MNPKILSSQTEALKQKRLTFLTPELLKESAEKLNEVEVPLINFEYLPNQNARLVYRGHVPATEKIVAYTMTRTVVFVYEDGAWKIDSVKTDYTN